MSEIKPFRERMSGLRGLIERQTERLASVLPQHLTPERMIALATTEIQRTPKLVECDVGSVIGAIVAASELGLEFGAKQHAHLVPFRIKGKHRCQLLIDYRGLAMLAEQHPDVRAAWAYVVRRGDDFAHELGTNPRVHHSPTLEAAPDPTGKDIVAAYAVVDLKTGRQLVEVMPRWEIDKVRASSRASGDGPWVAWYERQARKTVLRRVLNLVAATGQGVASSRLANAVRLDEASELGRAVVTVDAEAGTDLAQRARDRGVLDELADSLRQDNASPPADAPPADDDGDDASELGYRAWFLDGVDELPPMAEAGKDGKRVAMIESLVAGLGMLNVASADTIAAAFKPRPIVELDAKELKSIEREINAALDAK